MGDIGRFKTILEKKEKNPDVYFLRQEWEVGDLEQIAYQTGFTFFYIAGSRVKSNYEFWDCASEVMNFPKWFGRNRDAFYDLMRDLSWYPAKTFLLLYDEFQNYAQQEPDEFFYSYTGMKEAIKFQKNKKSSVLVYVLLKGDEGALPASIPELPPFD